MDYAVCNLFSYIKLRFLMRLIIMPPKQALPYQDRLQQKTEQVKSEINKLQQQSVNFQTEIDAAIALLSKLKVELYDLKQIYRGAESVTEAEAVIAELDQLVKNLHKSQSLTAEPQLFSKPTSAQLARTITSVTASNGWAIVDIEDNNDLVEEPLTVTPPPAAERPKAAKDGLFFARVTTNLAEPQPRNEALIIEDAGSPPVSPF